MAHEDLTRVERVEGSSNRSFGLVFAVVFLMIAAWPMLDGRALRWWAVVIAATFALLAVRYPSVLTLPNRWWTKFGLLLGKVVSPIALGLLFFGVITPLGAVMRLTGKDPLRLQLDRKTDSYWILRDPPGPPPASMTNQF